MTKHEDAARSEMPALPSDCEVYRRTRSFTERSVPRGLLREHSTAAGVWGRIVVERGELRYRVGGLQFTLAPGTPGIIEPEVLHEVEPVGELSFHVEFLRRGPLTER